MRTGDSVALLPELELKGRAPPWGTPALLALALLVAVGFWLRVHALSAEGFADDEVHKWYAANRYLHGDFGGDDIEHPMLMKWLIALSLLVGSRLSWSPEAMVRFPNAVAGAASIALIALLGRRLFGRAAGLGAAALATFSTTFIGYQRVAKEDTLLGLFLMLVLLCAAEAKASADDGRTVDQRRWEWLGAAGVGAMFASKYFFFFAPIPLAFYFWARGTGSQWRISFRRWLVLIAASLALFAAVNWTPLMPSSWEYQLSYSAEKKTIHGSLLFMGHIFHNLPSWGLRGTPPWFYAVFAAVKLAPPTFVASLIGLAFALWHRRPSHQLVLSWMGLWFLVLSASGSKWGRFFISILPAFLLLASHASVAIARWARRPDGSRILPVRLMRFGAPAVLSIALIGAEARASLIHAPHYRLYISALGGGDRRVDWFFPHCDYFDAGFREAIAYVAAHAESGSELATEIDWPAKYYAERFGRADLRQTLVRRGEACRGDRICYVVVQTGRMYFLNVDAVGFLAQRKPWHVERIQGVEVVKVYRLQPGESPFPDEDQAAAPDPPAAR